MLTSSLQARKKTLDKTNQEMAQLRKKSPITQEEYKKLDELNQKMKASYDFLGNYYLNEGKKVEALIYYETLLSYGNESRLAHLRCALLWEEFSPTKAIRHLHKVLELDQDLREYPQAFYYLARIEFNKIQGTKNPRYENVIPFLLNAMILYKEGKNYTHYDLKTLIDSIPKAQFFDFLNSKENIQDVALRRRLLTEANDKDTLLGQRFWQWDLGDLLPPSLDRKSDYLYKIHEALQQLIKQQSAGHLADMPEEKAVQISSAKPEPEEKELTDLSTPAIRIAAICKRLHNLREVAQKQETDYAELERLTRDARKIYDDIGYALYKSPNDWIEVLINYESSIAYGDECSAVHLNCALLYKTHGYTDKAIEHLYKVIELDQDPGNPKYPQAFYHLAILEYHKLIGRQDVAHFDYIPKVIPPLINAILHLPENDDEPRKALIHVINYIPKEQLFEVIKDEKKIPDINLRIYLLEQSLKEESVLGQRFWQKEGIFKPTLEREGGHLYKINAELTRLKGIRDGHTAQIEEKAAPSSNRWLLPIAAKITELFAPSAPAASQPSQKIIDEISDKDLGGPDDFPAATTMRSAAPTMKRRT